MNASLLLLDDTWVLRLLANHIGYVSFAIPVTILFIISKKAAYNHWPKPIRALITPLIRFCISDNLNLDNGSDEYGTAKSLSGSSVSVASSSVANFNRAWCYKLIISFFGLQISYLLWGLLQERIMTRTYDGEKFTNSQFLVFVNRFLATAIAYVALKICYPTRSIKSTRPPMFCYGIISYANCMSTWFQYESLLYISFPVQVIAKSIKTIPVMLVGKFVSGKTYPVRQYVLMLVMAAGIALFLTGYEEQESVASTFKKGRKSSSKITTLNGFVLLICYLAFDAFTSNYQKKVFDRYSISFLNMMFFVNLISSIITLASLIFNGTLWDCLSFMRDHQDFAVHALGTSLCSSVGQLFIFSTIEEFGPVVFTIIMTVRQAFSILLSCIFYGHHLNWIGAFGIQIAFVAILIHAFIQFKRSKELNNSNV